MHKFMHFLPGDQGDGTLFRPNKIQQHNRQNQPEHSPWQQGLNRNGNRSRKGNCACTGMRSGVRHKNQAPLVKTRSAVENRLFRRSDFQPDQPEANQTGYSGATVPESHRLPQNQYPMVNGAEGGVNCGIGQSGQPEPDSLPQWRPPPAHHPYSLPDACGRNAQPASQRAPPR